MENESVPKAYIRQLLRSSRLECIESNLNLELIGKMNEIATENYKSLTEDVGSIEENLNNILEEYQISEDVLAEIEGLDSVIGKLELSVDFLEEMTSRIEIKVNSKSS